MSGNITVSSTTDSQKDVDAAAEYGQQTLPLAEEEKPGPSEVDEAETVAAQEPAEESENREVEEEEPEEEEPQAAQAPAVTGRTRREREATISRLLAERDLRDLRDREKDKQIAEMQEQLRKLSQPKPDDSQRPDENDPKYVGKLGDFVADMSRHTRWLADQEKANAERQAADRQVTEQDQKLMADYNRQVDEAKEKYSDWVNIVRPLAETLPAAAIQAITRMRNGAEVAYHIGKDPELVQQLIDWGSPESVRGEGGADIIATVRQLSKQLSTPPPPPSSSSSRSPQPRPAAPRPLRHVGGTAMTAAAAPDPDKMTMKEFNAWRDAGGGR